MNNLTRTQYINFLYQTYKQAILDGSNAIALIKSELRHLMRCYAWDLRNNKQEPNKYFSK